MSIVHRGLDGTGYVTRYLSPLLWSNCLSKTSGRVSRRAALDIRAEMAVDDEPG